MEPESSDSEALDAEAIAPIEEIEAMEPESSDSEALDTEAIAPIEEIEAISPEEWGIETIDTLPFLEPETPNAVSLEATEDESRQPSDDSLVLETEPENSNEYQIYAPVEIPTIED